MAKPSWRGGGAPRPSRRKGTARGRMKKLLVFQHVAREILGTFYPLLRRARFRIRHVNFERTPDASVEVRSYDGLIVLGGPMGVYEAERYPHLAQEIGWIAEAVQRGLPVLGICLGAQLTAAALGAAVRPATAPEVGWYPVELTEEGRRDPILSHFGPREHVFQWHGDTFGIPDGASWLAHAKHCPHQAFRYGDRVYGFQFHLEVDGLMIERALK